MTNIEAHLTREQLDDYHDYKRVWIESWNNGTHHWQRIAAAREDTQPVDVEHCVPYTQPYDLDAPCAVFHPSPRFIAELMKGGIHPPISALLEQKLLIVAESGKSDVVSKVAAPQWRAENGPIASEYVVDNRRAHLEVEEPLTYDQAIEYCIMKEIPMAVWGHQHNRRQYVIMSKSALPDREARNAWNLSDMEIAA